MGVMRARGFRRILGGGRKMFTENNFATPLCYYRSETGLENGGVNTSDGAYFEALPSFVIGGLRIGWNRLSVAVLVQAPEGVPPTVDVSSPAVGGYLAVMREVGHGYECKEPGVTIPSHTRDDGYYPDDYEGIRPRRDATLFRLNNVLIPTNWLLEETISYPECGGTYEFTDKLPGEYKILYLDTFPSGSTVTIGIQTTE